MSYTYFWEQHKTELETLFTNRHSFACWLGVRKDLQNKVDLDKPEALREIIMAKKEQIEKHTNWKDRRRTLCPMS